MRTWSEERLRDFSSMVMEWGVSVSRNGLTCDAIKSPDQIDRMMQESNYLTNVRTVFDVSRADWDRLGLSARSHIQCEGVTYEIYKVRSDSADPIVQFDAVKTK